MKKHHDEDNALAVEAALGPAEHLQHALGRALALDPFDESRVRDDFMRAVGRIDGGVPPEFGGLLFEYEGRGDPVGDFEVQVTAEVEVWSSALADDGLGVRRFVAARWTRASLLPKEVIEEMRLEGGEFKVVRRSV